MTSPGFDELERALAAARKRLDALRARSSGAAERPVDRHADLPGNTRAGPAVHGSGEAADGRVRAVAVRDFTIGLIESVELDPRALRMDLGELAGHLAAALNAAMDDLRANAGLAAGGADSSIDLGALKKRLSEVQDQATRQLYQLTSGLQDVVAKIGRDANVAGAVAVPDVEELFLQTRRTLAWVDGAPAGTTSATTGRPSVAPAAAGRTGSGSGTPRGDTARGGGAAPSQDGEDVRGEGAAGAGGLARAIVGPGGHVESLSIEPAAARKGSHEVAGYVVSAVNAALEDLHRKQRDRIEAMATGRAELAEQVRTVQDLSLRQMRAFGESLAELMASITPDS